MQKKWIKPTQGFTLLEVVIVLVIIGVIAALVVPNITGSLDKARLDAAKQDILSLENALTMYKADNMRLPTTEQGLQALVAKPTIAPIPSNWRAGGYLSKTDLPKDPWGNDFKYLNPGVRNTAKVDIISYGADGQPGGEGEAADFGNWKDAVQ